MAESNRNSKSAFVQAGQVMAKMDALAKKPSTEENAFLALDLVKEASEILGYLRDDIAISMVRERIGKLQAAMGWQ